MCATCHVYVHGDWLMRVEPVVALEDSMLDSTACERRPDSRLGCQIAIIEALDGLVVHVPESQR
jgi:ferredoxin, 2Fe-2S